MAPPFRKIPPTSTGPRVGGMITFRKPGQMTHYALIEWINPDGTMRVRPERGSRQIITAADVARASRLAEKIAA
jgi:hypothetical protein